MKNIVILLLLVVFSNAQIIKTTKRVKGYGDTEERAIYNGLIHAIEQTNGLAIASSKSTITSSLKLKLFTPDGNFKYKLYSKQAISAVSTATQGVIQSYSVDDIQRDGDRYIAYLSVTISKYKTPGLNPNKRRKMAIFPFEYKDSYPILNRFENGREVSKRFTQSLVSKITQSRKFTVLDRENSKYYRSERNFILSGDSGKDELLKLGNRLGADYLVIGQILDYYVKREVEHSNIGLPDVSRIVCRTTIFYRILAMATQQIKWSETISFKFNLKDGSFQNSAEAIVATTTDKIADKILDNILSNIYPPMIIAVTARNIIVNQGGNSIHKGEIFRVYKMGEKLFDPYTKEPLGAEEIEVGKIKIVDVKPKVSYARVLDGKVSKGMILRRDKESKKRFESEGEAETDVKIAPGGGVVLPFD